MKKYPKPGHCAGLVQISPGQFSLGPDKVGIGPIPAQKLLRLDWTGLGRTRSGLVQCWTGGIIDLVVLTIVPSRGIILARRNIGKPGSQQPVF